MAVTSSKYRMWCTDHNLIIATGNWEGVSHHATKKVAFSRIPRKGKYCTIIRALNSFEKHKRSLDSYIGKLHEDTSLLSLKILKNTDKKDSRFRFQENYLDKDEVESQPETHASTDESGNNYLETRIRTQRFLKNYMECRADGDDFSQISEDEAFNFYVIGVLVSINVAVFLFEIASPVKFSSLGLVSLPTVYGAKINNLMLTGEWWRFVTPMFLHTGILHILLGSWIFFTFGPPVCRAYGPFTFVLIYILGGISGNLISFLHIPDPTVGGTGPAFAVIGAWLVYQAQNKGEIPKELSDKLYMKAIIATTLSFIISSFGMIDDWAHFGSAFTGIAYGFLTCPTFQVKDASSPGKSSQEERIAIVRRYADPCKSLAYFSITLLLLSFLAFILEPPLDLQ